MESYLGGFFSLIGSPQDAEKSLFKVCRKSQ
jgi:hypothetical protein